MIAEQPADERPNAGWETDWAAQSEHNRILAHEIGETAKANAARASSWWEAAKTLVRSNRHLRTAAGNNAIERNHERRRADAAEAKLQEETPFERFIPSVMSQLPGWQQALTTREQHLLDVAMQVHIAAMNRRAREAADFADERGTSAEVARLREELAAVEADRLEITAERGAYRAKLDAIRKAVYEGGQDDTSRCRAVRRLLPYTPAPMSKRGLDQ